MYGSDVVRFVTENDTAVPKDEDAKCDEEGDVWPKSGDEKDRIGDR